MSNKKKKKVQKTGVPVARRFYLKRKVDDSGVSGTGRVASGVQLPSGRVVVEWLSETPSQGLYNSIDHLIQVHGHEGHTEVEWVDNLETIVAEEK